MGALAYVSFPVTPTLVPKKTGVIIYEIVHLSFPTEHPV